MTPESLKACRDALDAELEKLIAENETVTQPERDKDKYAGRRRV